MKRATDRSPISRCAPILLTVSLLMIAWCSLALAVDEPLSTDEIQIIDTLESRLETVSSVFIHGVPLWEADNVHRTVSSWEYAHELSSAILADLGSIAAPFTATENAQVEEPYLYRDVLLATYWEQEILTEVLGELVEHTRSYRDLPAAGSQDERAWHASVVTVRANRLSSTSFLGENTGSPWTVYESARRLQSATKPPTPGVGSPQLPAAFAEALGRLGPRVKRRESADDSSLAFKVASCEGDVAYQQHPGAPWLALCPDPIQHLKLRGDSRLSTGFESSITLSRVSSGVELRVGPHSRVVLTGWSMQPGSAYRQETRVEVEYGELDLSIAGDPEEERVRVATSNATMTATDTTLSVGSDVETPESCLALQQGSVEVADHTDRTVSVVTASDACILWRIISGGWSRENRALCPCSSPPP